MKVIPEVAVLADGHHFGNFGNWNISARDYINIPKRVGFDGRSAGIVNI